MLPARNKIAPDREVIVSEERRKELLEKEDRCAYSHCFQREGGKSLLKKGDEYVKTYNGAGRIPDDWGRRKNHFPRRDRKARADYD